MSAEVPVLHSLPREYIWVVRLVGLRRDWFPLPDGVSTWPRVLSLDVNIAATAAVGSRASRARALALIHKTLPGYQWQAFVRCKRRLG